MLNLYRSCRHISANVRNFITRGHNSSRKSLPTRRASLNIQGHYTVLRTLHTSFPRLDATVTSDEKNSDAMDINIKKMRERIESQLRNEENSMTMRSSSRDEYESDDMFSNRRNNRQPDFESHDDYDYKPRGRREFDDGDNWSRQRRRSLNYDDDSDDFLAKANAKTTSPATELPPLEKNFFMPSTELLGRPGSDNDNYLKESSIIVTGTDIPPPIQHFSEQQFPEKVLELLQEFDAPTPIQAQGLSVALSGKDLIGIGQTGSGKTLGYLLPGLMHVAHQRNLLQEKGLNRNHCPLGLVLAPTRELVQQIMQVLLKYGPAFRIRSSAMFGGASRSRQLDSLTRNDAKIIVATPGRLIDFIMGEEISLNRCGFLVLDEADRMLDMGFEPQIRNIIKHTRSDRQTLMWSATWPQEVRQLAHEFLSDPVQISVGSTELRANPDIKQNVIVCDTREKRSMLEDLITAMIENDSKNQALVFCETKRAVDAVCSALNRIDVKAVAIHGDKSQMSRDKALNGFRKGYCSVLVASEVAARGIDIPALKCVINYDMPTSTESYVHRIGRTGRRGLKGLAYTFLTHSDSSVAGPLIKILKDSNQNVPEELEDMAANHRHSAPKKNNKGPRGGYGGRRGNDSRGYGYNRGPRW